MHFVAKCWVSECNTKFYISLPMEFKWLNPKRLILVANTCSTETSTLAVKFANTFRNYTIEHMTVLWVRLLLVCLSSQVSCFFVLSSNSFIPLYILRRASVFVSTYVCWLWLCLQGWSPLGTYTLQTTRHCLQRILLLHPLLISIGCHLCSQGYAITVASSGKSVAHCA